ncbi:MAG: hypothetical protein IT285_15130 [Bdellovibrionales bacterium]|nr:hypothetical protein [Bdellovibrionales bacterium]
MRHHRLLKTIAAAALILGSGRALAAPLDSWRGVWSGPCEDSGIGHQYQNVRLELRIGVDPAPAGALAWTIVWRMPGKPADRRAYLMRPKDASKGWFVLDERNGIFIDHFLGGDGVMRALFHLPSNGTLIGDRTELRGGKLRVEMPSWSDSQAEDYTGPGGIVVRSLPLPRVSVCVLSADSL